MTVLAALAVALGAVAQAITGFGFSLVTAPFLVAAYRAPEGVRLNLVLSALLNVALLWRERRSADGRAAALLLVPAVAATVPAALVVRHVAPGPLTVGAGLVCLAGVVATGRGRRFAGLTGPRGTVVTGALSGAMNVVAGMSGPAVVLFAVNADWRPQRIRPTLQLYFLVLNLAALAVLGPPDRVPALVLVALAGGTLAGAGLAGRPRDRAVRTFTLLVAGLGSLLAVARGLAT